MAKVKETTKPIKEPTERLLYRIGCKHIGYTGTCFKHSGYFGIGDGMAHISMGCNGKCRRMVLWDNKHGYKGVEFKLLEIF